MIRPRGKTVSVVVALVAAIPIACAGKTEQEDPGATSSDLTADGSDPGDAGSATVTLCHMPPGNPANMHLITVGAAAAPKFEARGDGVCSAGATDCCLESGPTSLCTNLSTDAANCGACGTACPAGQVCSSGACVCLTGETLCGSACVNESSDNSNCGGCGIRCGGELTCQNGSCTCPAGESLCGGACVNESSDNFNCGGCNVFCSGGSTCENGSCTCPAGQTYCGVFPARPACTNLQSDPNNCGACGTTCVTANGFGCSAGACGCSSGLTQCGNACVNPATDTLNPVPGGNYVPLSGSADVSGTEGVPGPPQPPRGCSSTFTTSPTSGTLTFSFLGFQSPNGEGVPTTCSFSYGGLAITLSGATSFDGDTYTCGETGDGASLNLNSLCPGFNHEDGVSFNFSLTVTRSTGAVSVTHVCTFADAICPGGTFLAGSTLDIKGSLSCPADAGAN